MAQIKATFVIDSSKFLNQLSATNGDYGPIGRLVIEAILKGDANAVYDGNIMSDYGITITNHEIT